LWRDVNRLHIKKESGTLNGSMKTQQWDIAPDWYAVGFSTKEKDKFQGFHNKNVLIIVDEASGYPDELFTALDGCLTGERTRMLFIGNPLRGSGRFYKAFRSKNWTKRTLSVFDHPNVSGEGVPVPGAVTKEWLTNIREEYGEDSTYWLTRVLAEFPSTADDTFCTPIQVEEAIERDEGFEGSSVIAVDVARFGADETVLLRMKGGTQTHVRRFAKTDKNEVVSHVRDLYHEAQSNLIVVDTAPMPGVVDDLQAMQYPAIEFDAGAKAVTGAEDGRPRYANRRAEAWYLLKEMIDELALSDEDCWRAELPEVRFNYSLRGAIQVEKKADLKKRLSRSPDNADALVMALWGQAAGQLDEEVWQVPTRVGLFEMAGT